MARIRILGEGDEPALENFLRERPDTSMFLRSNLHAAGIVHTGEPYTADYAAALDGDAVVAVAAHSWGGNLVLEAPRALAELVRAVAAHSGRGVDGIVGVAAQVREARSALGLESASVSLDSTEDLLGLDLDALAVPDELSAEGTRCRLPEPRELDLLTAWRVAYEMEALGALDDALLRRRCRESIELYQQGERHFVLEQAGRLVSYSAFNAALEDCVQIGGVYTPPELRRGRRARCVVAGSLLQARGAGVRRSVLFTATDNRAAQRAYRALGYERVGNYGILHFAKSQRPG